MDEFQPEVANPGVSPLIQMRTGFLGFRAEHSVAAAYVGQHRMRPALSVLEFHAMRFARAAAIAIAGSLRQEAAKDAVLGVTYRQVLIGDGFNILHANAER